MSDLELRPEEQARLEDVQRTRAARLAAGLKTPRSRIGGVAVVSVEAIQWNIQEIESMDRLAAWDGRG